MQGPEAQRGGPKGKDSSFFSSKGVVFVSVQSALHCALAVIGYWAACSTKASWSLNPLGSIHYMRAQDFEVTTNVSCSITSIFIVINIVLGILRCMFTVPHMPSHICVGVVHQLPSSYINTFCH